jgi:hypothetical protein
VSGEEPTSLEDSLPDAQLFLVHIADDYFKDIIDFLTIGTTPPECSAQKKKKLVVEQQTLL